MAQAFLFSLGRTDEITIACELAVQRGLAHRADAGAIHFAADVREELPLVLRGFVGCAGIIYGDLDEARLLRIDALRNILSLFFVPDFNAKLPRVTREVRIDLARQSIRDRLHVKETERILICRSAYAADEAERRVRVMMEGRIRGLMHLPNGCMTARHADLARALRKVGSPRTEVT